MRVFWGMIFAVLLPVSALAVPPSSAIRPLDAKVIQILKDSKIKTARAGVYAVSMPDNKVLVDINKDIPLNPASCMKLITTAVALKTLGPNYQFPTQFYLTSGGPTHERTNALTHDLWVKGYGDPSLVIERLEEAVNKLIKAGLPANIDNIYIDDTYFDGGHFPGRQKGSARSYNALTSAVALNHGAVTVEVFPNERPGEPALVNVDAPGLYVENKATTGPRRGKNTIRISRTYTKNGDTVVVTGRISLNSGGRKQFFSVANPAEHFAESFKTMLTERGINVAGRVGYGIVPKVARLIYEERSQPLSEVLKDMNKNSSNFMAEQITKIIGAHVQGVPGSTEKGVNEFNKYLAQLGVKDFYVENGSGLSYNNEISPAVLMAVMKDIYARPSLKNVLIDSLSVAGEDGTLKKWNGYLKGKLKAKTGSLNGVSTLAGFWPERHGTMLFVVFLNGGVDFWRGRNVSQKIVEALTGS